MKAEMNTIKLEIKRSFRSRGFLIAVIIGIVCILYKNIDFYIKIREYYEAFPKGEFYEELNKQTFYSVWLVGDFTNAITMYIFYFLGLIVTIPFGVSYYLDKKKGYVKNICVRAGRKCYLKAKFTAVFLSGGVAVLVPVLLDFLFSKIWIPHDFVYMPFTILNTRSEWGVFVIDHLYISAIIIFVAWFVFGGALATVSLVVSVIAEDYFTIMLTPFFLMLILIYIPNFVPDKLYKYFPYYFLSMFGDSNPIIGIVISGLMTILTFSSFYVAEAKKDIL